MDAGRDAAARNAWRDAFELLSQADAQEALGPADLEMLAEAAWWSGKLQECIDARERAYGLYLEAGEPRKAALVALHLSNDYFAKLAQSVGAGWFNRAERLLESEGDCVEQGYLATMRALGELMRGNVDVAVEEGARALDIGMRFGDRDVQGFGLLMQGSALVRKGEVDKGLAMLDEATVAAVGGELGPYAAGIVYCVSISVTAAIADYDRAGQWTEASRRWCERQSIAGFPGICRVHRAEIMRLRGAWVEAEQEARRALTELRSFDLQFAAAGFYELGEVRLRMGDLEGAEDAFRQAHELGREPQPGLALLRLVEGKPEAAFASLKRAFDDASPDRLARARLVPALVEAAIAAGDAGAARAAVLEFEETLKTYDSVALQASYYCSLGAVQHAEGDSSAAVSSLSRSLKLWTKAGLPYEAARARLGLGTALRATGDEEGAALEIRAARSAFEKLGAVVDLRQAIEMLDEDGAAPSAHGGSRLNKTFMFTDIVGSTNLAEVLGDEAWSGVLSWHDSALRRSFEDHGGEEIKHTGDGFFVAFDTPRDAIECAAAIQRALADHRKASGFAPRVRIGLHRAEATRKGRDYEGKGVHAAARIGALAQGDEVLASEEVLAAERIRFPVSEFRTVELKGIAEPVQVASIDVA